MSLFGFLKKKQKEEKDAEEIFVNSEAECDDEEFAPAKEESFHAKVIDRVCGVNTKTSNAYKIVKTVKEFLIVFEDDERKFHKILVKEDMYDAFEEGQVGTLTLIGGRLDSFVLDEE